MKTKKQIVLRESLKWNPPYCVSTRFFQYHFFFLSKILFVEDYLFSLQFLYKTNKQMKHSNTVIIHLQSGEMKGLRTSLVKDDNSHGYQTLGKMEKGIFPSIPTEGE